MMMLPVTRSRPARALIVAAACALLLSLTPSGAPPAQASGPIRIEAEDYLAGGEGVGYHDSSPGNYGDSRYRADDVDMSSCDAHCSGQLIHNFYYDEWLAFTLRVRTAGDYTIVVRYTTAFRGKQLRLVLDDADLGVRDAPYTGPGGAWTDLQYATVRLSAGRYRLQLVAATDAVDVDYLELRDVNDPPPATPPPPPDAPPPAPPAGEPPLLQPPTHQVNTGPLFQLDCESGPRRRDDPIVAPRRPGASHEHQFFGALAVDAAATYETLLRGGTTCGDAGDTAAYWIPTLYDEQGVLRAPTRMRVYYYANAEAPGEVVAFPANLRMIAGDAGARGPQAVGAIDWFCRKRASQAVGLLLAETGPPRCDGDEYLSLSVRFPDCWDGRHLDSSDHRRHMAYSDAERRCPATHPVKVPKLRLSVIYDDGEFTGGAFTLGGPRGVRRALPWYAMHADFWNTWDQAALETYVEGCLRQGRTVRKTGCQP